MAATDERMVKLMAATAILLVLFIGSVLLNANICILLILLMSFFALVFIGYSVYHPRDKERM